MRRQFDARGLLIAEATGITFVVSMIAIPLFVAWEMLHLAGYYGLWVEAMNLGYAFILFDTAGRLVQNKVVCRWVSKRAVLGLPTIVALLLLNVLPDSFKGLLLAGLNSSLFLLMVLTLTQGLAILGVVWYLKVFKKDIDEERSPSNTIDL